MKYNGNLVGIAYSTFFYIFAHEDHFVLPASDIEFILEDILLFSGWTKA